MFGTKRLKKKSQSVDISGPGCNPVAAEAPAPQPSKPLLATKTTSEEEQKNTANTQRRNPRRSELKRYYTIVKHETLNGLKSSHSYLAAEVDRYLDIDRSSSQRETGTILNPEKKLIATTVVSGLANNSLVM